MERIHHPLRINTNEPETSYKSPAKEIKVIPKVNNRSNIINAITPLSTKAREDGLTKQQEEKSKVRTAYYQVAKMDREITLDYYQHEKRRLKHSRNGRLNKDYRKSRKAINQLEYNKRFQHRVKKLARKNNLYAKEPLNIGMTKGLKAYDIAVKNIKERMQWKIQVFNTPSGDHEPY